jgi:hypothetical protein
MQVTDAQVAALRAFLVHDPDSALPMTAQLGDQGMGGYLYLAEAALCVLAGRRFSPQFTRADLIRYVASVRASRIGDGSEYDFDPAAAERVLRYLLGSTDVRIPDSKPRLRLVVALLDALAESELSGEAEVDALLAEARDVADQWAINGTQP